MKVIQQLRAEGIRAELYPDASKMKKQMKYANDKKIQFVVMVGEDEMNSGQLSLKNMQSGEQSKIIIEELINSMS